LNLAPPSSSADERAIGSTTAKNAPPLPGFDATIVLQIGWASRIQHLARLPRQQRLQNCLVKARQAARTNRE
jgi:hypothetical protein